MTFEEVVSFYISTTTHRSKRRDESSLLRLRPHFTGKAIADIRRADLRAYIRRRQLDGVKLATVRRELVFLSAAINHARIELEQDMPNPVRSLGLPLGEERVRWLTRQEAKELIREASTYARTPHLPAFIRLALNTGCRSGELLQLEWNRVNFEAAMLLLEARHTKSGKRRTVPLNKAALSALRTLKEWNRQHAPLAPWVFASQTGRRVTTLKKGFRGSCDRAGITDFRIHDLRHTCASWLVMNGVSLYVVRELLGHSSVTVTERYAHLSPDETRAAVSVLEAI